MKVILLERVYNLGELGDQVRVKAGFGRNWLIPQGKAIPVTAANVELFEARRAEHEKAALQRLEAAKERAARLEGLSVSITANAGDEGRLFGSVGAHEIARAVAALGHELAKNEIYLPEGAFRQIGDYEVTLQLQGHEVLAKIQVSITTA